MTYTLYGMAASLYTARVRSYMRINAVPFVEKKAGSAEFTQTIVPETGRWMIPVVKTPDGQIIQDGADIIDHLDEAGFSKAPIYPQDPVLLAIAHVFELFGAQGLLRPAMHYRWNFDEVNLPFIRDTFRDVLPDGLTPEAEEAVFLQASGRMRKATSAFGVFPETFKLVEESYAQFLALMNTHLHDHPFMLGGHPTIADYGLIGAMYAHLGRDPEPLRLMQSTAPRVFRWVERMNMAETFEDEQFVRSKGALFAGDTLPKTLLDILSFIGEDYLPEITAHVEFANAWLDTQDAGSDEMDKGIKGALGMAKFNWRGASIASMVLPYRFYLLSRLQDAVERQSAKHQSAVRQIFEQAGIADLLNIQTKRRVERANNQEVWGGTT